MMTKMTQTVDTNLRHFNNTLTKLTNISTKIYKYIKGLKTVLFISIHFVVIRKFTFAIIGRGGGILIKNET